jgi:flavin-dependent dehydrogenase
VSQHPAFPKWQAVVVGGSIAGLLAARALAEVCARVTVVERDQYPQEPGFRAGTPQSRHVHVLLARGRHILEELFPGISAELQQRGATGADMLGDMAYCQGTTWLPRLPSDVWTLLCSRSLLEWQIKRMLLDHWPNVRILERHEVVGLVATPGGERVTGVRLRKRPGPSGEDTPPTSTMEDAGTSLAADLVLDASGRHSKSPAWLRELGYDAPAESRVDSHISYASRVYALPEPPDGRSWRGMVVSWDPPRHLRGGVIWPQEDGSWLVTLGGAGGENPPTDEAGFVAFAQSLPVPEFYEAIREGEPQTPIYGYADMSNFRRYYERLKRLPDGFVALGDTFCAFDPVYGQGMSVAAMASALLRDMLRRRATRDLRGFGRHFHRALARQVALPWQMATAIDVRVPGAEGGTTGLTTRLMQRYLDRVTRLLPTMEQAQRAFIGAAHFVAPPRALFAPAILARALTLPPDPAARLSQANTHQHHAGEHEAETAHLEDSPQA